MPYLRDVGKKSIEACGIDKLSFGQVKNAERIIQKMTKGDSEWEGWGTGLKPAVEEWILCRKRLSEKSIISNVIKWGTGGINIDGCRVEHTENLSISRDGDKAIDTRKQGWGFKAVSRDNNGRYPANLIHDGSEEVVNTFPNTGSGNNKKPYNYKGKEYNNKDTSIFNGDKPEAPSNYNDNGSAARYFYCAKASREERDMGLNVKNNHPTVKPKELCRYLCRMITPKDGIVLDLFMGSGSVGIGAIMEGFKFIGIDKEEDYIKIAQARLEYWNKYKRQGTLK